MKNVKVLVVILGMCLALLSGCSEKTDKYVVAGVVNEVGSCGGNEGFFSGSYECAVSVTTKRNIEYWTVYGKIMKGQTIYKHCWTDSDNQPWCSSVARTKIQNGFMK